MMSQFDGITIFNFQGILFDSIESAHHKEGHLIPHNLHLRIILSEQSDRTTMVRFHVVDNQVIYLSVSDDIVNILQKLTEEIDINGINQTHFIVINKIRIVRNAIRQWP